MCGTTKSASGTKPNEYLALRRSDQARNTTKQNPKEGKVAMTARLRRLLDPE